MKKQFFTILSLFVFASSFLPLVAKSENPSGAEQISPETETSNQNRFFEFGLEYPTNFGVHLRYPLMDGIYTHFGLGFMPEFFLNSFEQFAPSIGHFNEEEAKIISNTFKNSIYLDFRFSWVPYFKQFKGGPYLEIGASGIFFGNGELKGSTLSKVLPQTEFDELKKYSAKTNSYNATVHVGYQIPFEKVKLNIEVGLIKIIKTDILNVKTLLAPKLLSKKQKQSFQNFLEKKGWIFPTISGWISFSF